MNRLWIPVRGLWAAALLMGAAGCLLAGCNQNQTAEAPAPVAKQETSVSAPHAEPVSPPAAEPVSKEIRQTYQWYCAQCHGRHGKGDGLNARHLTVLPRDHTKADYLQSRSDEQLFAAIRQGGLAVGRAPCMPAWGHTLDEATIHGLVRYIRELCHCEAA